MSRMQTSAPPKASNNVFTVLAGVAVLVTLLTLVFTFLRWQNISQDPLFFGIF